MAMEDPLLMQAFHSLSDSDEANRLNAYVSLLIQNLQMLWDSRDIEEDELRANLADLLVTEAGRRYWQEFGHVRMALFTDRRRQQEFIQIIDEVSRTPGRAVGAAEAGALRPPAGDGGRARGPGAVAPDWRHEGDGVRLDEAAARRRFGAAAGGPAGDQRPGAPPAPRSGHVRAGRGRWR